MKCKKIGSDDPGFLMCTIIILSNSNFSNLFPFESIKNVIQIHKNLLFVHFDRFALHTNKLVRTLDF